MEFILGLQAIMSGLPEAQLQNIILSNRLYPDLDKFLVVSNLRLKFSSD